jgi:Trk K+ transport system NAD-binding subunit
MKIIILGAGQVGSNLAEHLVREGNDLTVVDLDAEKLAALQDRFDLRTVCGQASHPAILKAAGAEDADMLVAVTLNDETNMVACKLGGTLFNIPTKIARIRAIDYMKYPQLFGPENFGVDHVIAPEQEITDYLRKLIDYPEALQVVDFGGTATRHRHGPAPARRGPPRLQRASAPCYSSAASPTAPANGLQSRTNKEMSPLVDALDALPAGAPGAFPRAAH